MFRSPIAIAGILVLSAALPGAAQSDAPKTAKKKEVASVPPLPTNLFWPLPPDPPRIRWVTQYDDLTKYAPPKVTRKVGFVEKLSGAKAGPVANEKVQMHKPYGITTDTHGRIYVADWELKVVWVIDPATNTLTARGGSSRRPLVKPVGVAVDDKDRLFISDAELHSIICMTPAGEPISLFGTGDIGRPGGIAIDRKRNRLYVADAKGSKIVAFDTESFKLTGIFGGPSKTGGKEDLTFSGPTNVAVDKQGMIYVADTMNNRVQILDSDGKFIRSFGRQGDTAGEFIRPKGIGVDSEGHVYVADSEFNNFQIFSNTGQSLLAVGGMGTAPGQFLLLTGLYIDGEDTIYTTEMYQGRVQVFHYIPQPGSATPRQGGELR